MFTFLKSVNIWVEKVFTFLKNVYILVKKMFTFLKSVNIFRLHVSSLINKYKWDSLKKRVSRRCTNVYVYINVYVNILLASLYIYLGPKIREEGVVL